MLKALVPFVVGILIADGVALPLWGVAIGFVVCAVMAVALRQRAVAEVYIVVAIMLAGAMALGIRQHFSTTPDTRTRMEIVIDKITSKRERATMTDARLVAYNTEKSTIKSSAELRVTAAAEVDIKEGERLLVDAKIMPFDDVRIPFLHDPHKFSQHLLFRHILNGERTLPAGVVRHPDDTDGIAGAGSIGKIIARLTKRLNIDLHPADFIKTHPGKKPDL